MASESQPRRRTTKQSAAGGRDRNGVLRRSAPVVLDEADKTIVEQLQQDGRRPYTQIAREVGLSEAAVRQRAQRLIEGGVIQIVAVTDPLTVGFHREAMIAIKADGDLRGIADRIAAIPEVDYVVFVAGAHDLLVEIVAEDDEHLLMLLNDEIRSIPGVTAAETFIYLKLHKQTYQWGAR